MHYNLSVKNNTNKTVEVVLFGKINSKKPTDFEKDVSVFVEGSNYKALQKELMDLGNISDFESTIDYRIRSEDQNGTFVEIKNPHQFAIDMATVIFFDLPANQQAHLSFDFEKLKTVQAEPSPPQNASPRELSYGERAVGITFNPGKLESVEKIKMLSAALINELNTQRDATADGEAKAQFTLAIRKIQEGQMWGLKAATWNLGK